jgi:hypothetical protein
VHVHPPAPGAHRYLLDVRLAEGPLLLVIQKNPSRADATRSDPTARAVERWAANAGFGRILFANLFAWRSPQPAALNGCDWVTAVGPDNDEAIRHALALATAPGDRIVAAWGNPNGIDKDRYAQRVGEVSTLLAGHPLWRHGSLTRMGHPRHGLWWRTNDGLLPWDLQPPAAAFQQAASVHLCAKPCLLDTLAPSPPPVACAD